MSRKSPNIYIASFFIGEVDGPGDFTIDEETNFVHTNWDKKATAFLLYNDLKIEAIEVLDDVVYDEEESTYLFYLSGKFEISVDALRIIESTIDEDGIPSSQLFQLDCGQYNYQCGYVEKDE